jgi:hypothetical protein
MAGAGAGGTGGGGAQKTGSVRKILVGLFCTPMNNLYTALSWEGHEEMWKGKGGNVVEVEFTTCG